MAEAGLSLDVGTASKGDLTLEILLEEKRQFDLTTQFERLGTENNVVTGWKQDGV